VIQSETHLKPNWKVLDHVWAKTTLNLHMCDFQKEHFFSVRSFAGKCAGVRKSALVVRTLLWAPNPQISPNFH